MGTTTLPTAPDQVRVGLEIHLKGLKSKIEEFEQFITHCHSEGNGEYLEGLVYLQTLAEIEDKFDAAEIYLESREQALEWLAEEGLVGGGDQ